MWCCGSVAWTQCANGDGLESVVEWAEGRGFEFESEEGRKGGGFGGWMGWMWVWWLGVKHFVIVCHINPSLNGQSQSSVFQSRCVLASSTNFMVLVCPARCGHCARHSESGMALGMMSLQSSHLTHAWSSTTLCVMSQRASFFLLNHGWNSVPSRNACCVCGTNEFTESPFACAKIAHSGFTNLHSKCVFNSLRSWCIQLFYFSLWMLNVRICQQQVMIVCIVVTFNECYLMNW